MDVTLTARGPRLERDLEITAPPGTSMSTLRPYLLDLLGGAGHQAIFSAGRVLPADALLGGTGLRSGAVLTLGSEGDRYFPRAAMLQLRVVSGPDCGQLVALTRAPGLSCAGVDPTSRSLRKVPLVESRSRSQTPWASTCSSACTREMSGSSILISAA